MKEERGKRGKGKGLPYSPEELKDRCGDYFARCDREGKKYTRPGLILALDLTEEEFDAALRGGPGKKAQAADVLRWAILRMRDDLEQRSDSMSVLRLKQPCYGGYADRPQADKGGETIRVSVVFSGEDREAGKYGQ